MMSSAPITRDTLQGYADGQLSAEERARVAAWLAEHPEDAAEVSAWQADAERLRAAFAPILAEPIPPHLLATARAPRRVWRHAAALGWIAVGALLGYGVRAWVAPPPITVAESAPRLPREAAIAHAVYVPEVRHPVEVGADQEAHLVAWLSKRLGTLLRVPTLTTQGYALVGGRLLPGDEGPVAQFMYQHGDGRRLTLYVSRGGPGESATAFRFAQEAAVSVFYWVDGPLGFALSGEMPRAELLPVAQAVYGQLNP